MSSRETGEAVRRRRLPQSVTIRTIAQSAGVSPATVSRVLNRVRPVSDELTKRVLTAVDHHSFKPNHIARALKGHSTLTLGVIVSDFANPFFTAVVRGIEEVALGAQHSVILCNSDEMPERERGYLDLLRAKHLEGLILCPCAENSPDAARAIQDTPIVLIDRELRGVRADVVRVDNIRGVKAGISHLAELGHKLIATISGPSHLTTGFERLAGYLEMLESLSIDVPPGYVQEGNFRQESGYDLAKRLLELKPRPTAVFVANNLMTLGAMIAFNEAGVAIPGEMSVIGLDDFDWARLSRPPLTVIAQPSYEVGRISGELLLSRINGRSSQVQTVLLTPELLVRDSTGPPRSLI